MQDESTASFAKWHPCEAIKQIDRPIIRTSNLAIHLDRNVNSDGFKVNFQNHLPPMLATSIKSVVSGEGGNKTSFLQKIIAESIDVAPEDIVDMELQVW